MAAVAAVAMLILGTPLAQGAPAEPLPQQGRTMWQGAQAQPPAAREGSEAPGRPSPRLTPEEARRAELDRLFAALRDAPDEAGGALVESRIWALWERAASPSVQLLMRRGMRNLEARAPEEALEDFDAAITLAPDFADAWFRRAQAHAAAGDTAAAVRDLQQALRLEPRHFGALATLSAIQEEAGDYAGALRSFQAALAIHPKLRGGEMRLRDLRRRALGEST